MTESAVGTGATSEPVPAPGEGEDIIAPSNRPTGAWSPAAWVPRASFTRGGDGRPVTAAWAPTCLPRPRGSPVALSGSNRLPKLPTRRARQLRFRHQPPARGRGPCREAAPAGRPDFSTGGILVTSRGGRKLQSILAIPRTPRSHASAAAASRRGGGIVLNSFRNTRID